MADGDARAHRSGGRTGPPAAGEPLGALTVLALLALVLGNWLFTALREGPEGQLVPDGPLPWLPALTPASWLLQPVAVLFLLGGHVSVRSYAAARARRVPVPYRAWLRGWLPRLLRPVLLLVLMWGALAGFLLVVGGGGAGGGSGGTVHSLLTVVLVPLWPLPVLAVLMAATPLAARISPLWPLAVVLHVDLYRYGYGSVPDALGWLNLLAVWLIPYGLGVLWARGAFRRTRSAVALLALGATGTAALVLWAGYPAAVHSPPYRPGPPTLAVVTVGLAQCGGALLLRGPLRRASRRRYARTLVGRLAPVATTVFLWHQTALVAVTATAGGLAATPLTGLHTAPDDAAWLAARLAWLPAFALALTLCVAAFGGDPRDRCGPRRSRGSDGPRGPRPAPRGSKPGIGPGPGPEREQGLERASEQRPEQQRGRTCGRVPERGSERESGAGPPSRPGSEQERGRGAWRGQGIPQPECGPAQQRGSAREPGPQPQPQLQPQSQRDPRTERGPRREPQPEPPLAPPPVPESVRRGGADPRGRRPARPAARPAARPSATGGVPRPAAARPAQPGAS